MNITRNASSKNYLKYCKLLQTKYPHVINPRPSGHTEIEFYNLKRHFLPPELQKPEHKVLPRFKIQPKLTQPSGSQNNNSVDNPGKAFYPRDARYINQGNNSILANQGFQRIQNIIDNRNRIATGGSKRGRSDQNSFPDAKRRRMSNSGLRDSGSHRL